MADRWADADDGLAPQFDRIRRAGEAPEQRSRDDLGKEALYSTAPTAAPAPHLQLSCRGCGVPFGLSLGRFVRLLVPPFVWDPIRGRLWARCPACGRRSWLEVDTGQALRAWFDRPPRT